MMVGMDDMIQEILVRLPVKSLARCKSLSKHWHSFISHNQCFRQNYLSRNRGCSLMLGFFFSQQCGGFHWYPSQKVGFLPTSTQGRRGIPTTQLMKRKTRDWDEDDDEVWDWDEDEASLPTTRTRTCTGTRTTVAPPAPPLPVDDDSLTFLGHPTIHLLGSSNGFLFCSLDEHDATYIICNPITKQRLPLPPPNTPSTDYAVATHGFICHPCPDLDYKVVRALSSDPEVFSTSLTMEIVSSASPQWKLFNLTCPFPFILDFAFCSVVVTDQGVVYLPATMQKQKTPCLLIFDHRKQEDCLLQLLEVPPAQIPQEDCLLQLLEVPPAQIPEYSSRCFGLSDGLLLYAQHQLGQLKIWALNECTREWSLMHKVALDSHLPNYPEFTQHWYTDGLFTITAFHPMNPRLLFVSIDEKNFLFDIDISRLEFIFDFAAQGCTMNYYLFPYNYGLIGPHLFLDG